MAREGRNLSGTLSRLGIMLEPGGYGSQMPMQRASYIPRTKPERPMTEYEKAVAKLQNKLSIPTRPSMPPKRFENRQRSFLRPSFQSAEVDDPVTFNSDDNYLIKTEYPDDSADLGNGSHIDDLSFEDNPLQNPSDEDLGLGPPRIENDDYDLPATPSRLEVFDDDLKSRNKDIKQKIKRIRRLKGVVPEASTRTGGNEDDLDARNHSTSKKLNRIKRLNGESMETKRQSYQTSDGPENYPIKLLKEEFSPVKQEYIPLGEEFGPIDDEISSLPLPQEFCDDDTVSNDHEAKKKIKHIKNDTNLFDIKPKIKAEDIEDIILDDNVVDKFEVVENDGSLVQKFECKICDFITKDPKYLQRHLRENHKYKISVCMKKKIPEDAKEHFGVEGDSFKCKNCGYLAKKRKYLLRHIKEKHLEEDEVTEKEQECPNCNFRTHRTKSLKKHIKVNHSEHLPDKRCDRCEYVTKQNHRLKRHINEVHEAVRDKNCDQCDKSFKRKANLDIHKKIEHEGLKIERKKYPWIPPGAEKRYTCTMCPYAHWHKGNMNQHINNVHFKAEASMCPHCEFRCTRKRTMSTHIKFVHEKCEDFKCNDCGYLFYAASKLRKHQQAVHQKVKNEICEHCGGGFFGKANLREHVKVVHFQIREYRCDECGFEAAARSNLKGHLVKANHTSKLDKLDVGFDSKTMKFNSENNTIIPPQQPPQQLDRDDNLMNNNNSFKQDENNGNINNIKDNTVQSESS